MPPPKRGEPGYAEYREQYNERRRKRLEDPDIAHATQHERYPNG